MWRRAPYSYAFSIDNCSIYSAENLTNGLLNHYCGTNMWMSEGQYVDIAFDKPASTNRIELTFNADPDKRLKNSACVDYTVISQIISDFDIIGYNGTEEKLLASVTGNYQRRRVIKLDGKHYDGLRVLVKKTNGAETAQLFAVSVY